MRFRRLWEVLGFIVVVVALVAGITALAPAALTRTTRVTPPSDSKVVCVPPAETGTVFAGGADAIRSLDADATPASGSRRIADQKTPVVLSGEGVPFGGTLTGTGAGSAWTPCAPARSRGVLVVPSAADTELVLVNSDAADAAVDLTLLGPGGEIQALGSRGIAVSANGTRTIALSVLVDVEGPVAVLYAASRGRVTAITRTHAVAGTTSSVASTQAKDLLLAGIPQGGTATVLLANPGDERATATITAFGSGAPYTPAGGDGLSVEPHSTLAVNLGDALAGQPTALRVSADVAVAATLVTGTTVVAPVAAATQLSSYAPAGGVLQITSTEAAEVAVSVLDVASGKAENSTQSVPAGATVVLTLPAAGAEGQQVTLTAPTPIAAAQVSSVDGALMVVPLTLSGAVGTQPIAAELDPRLR